MKSNTRNSTRRQWIRPSRRNRDEKPDSSEVYTDGLKARIVTLNLTEADVLSITGFSDEKYPVHPDDKILTEMPKGWSVAITFTPDKRSDDPDWACQPKFEEIDGRKRAIPNASYSEEKGELLARWLQPPVPGTIRIHRCVDENGNDVPLFAGVTIDGTTYRLASPTAAAAIIAFAEEAGQEAKACMIVPAGEAAGEKRHASTI